MKQLLFIILITVTCLEKVDASSIVLTEEKVQRITISDFSQVIDIVQMLRDKGISQQKMVAAQDWDCYFTDDYFKDSVLRSSHMPGQVEQLKALVATFILTGRWVDAAPDMVQVEKVMKSLQREFSHSSPTLSPYDVFQYYHGITPKSLLQNSNPSQQEICRMYAQQMQEQSHIKINDQHGFQNLAIDLRSGGQPYGYFVDGFCFTNGQINSKLKADTLVRLLDHPSFPLKDLDYVIYGDDDPKYINFVEEVFKSSRKERLITLYFPNSNSQ